jgi:TolA-binding protein
MRKGHPKLPGYIKGVSMKRIKKARHCAPLLISFIIISTGCSYKSINERELESDKGRYQKIEALHLEQIAKQEEQIEEYKKEVEELNIRLDQALAEKDQAQENYNKKSKEYSDHKKICLGVQPGNSNYSP